MGCCLPSILPGKMACPFNFGPRRVRVDPNGDVTQCPIFEYFVLFRPFLPSKCSFGLPVICCDQKPNPRVTLWDTKFLQFPHFLTWKYGLACWAVEIELCSMIIDPQTPFSLYIEVRVQYWLRFLGMSTGTPQNHSFYET